MSRGKYSVDSHWWYFALVLPRFHLCAGCECNASHKILGLLRDLLYLFLHQKTSLHKTITYNPVAASGKAFETGVRLLAQSLLKFVYETAFLDLVVFVQKLAMNLFAWFSQLV